MGSLFSKKSPKAKSRVTDQDRAILNIKQLRDKLKQYQKRVQAQIENERALAKKLFAEGRKDKALMIMRKKKYQESQLDKTDNQLDNLERMAHDIEFTSIESQVVEGLRVGNETLKQMHELLTLEDVEKIMDDAQDGIEYQKQIDALMSGGLSEEDETDALEELDEIIKASLPEVPAHEKEPEDLDLPEVPQEEPQPARAKARAKERTAEVAS